MKPYLSPVRPHVLAHRGLTLGGTLDENTIEAFRAALAAGATHLETDVQVTLDGVAVLFHDDDLNRVGGQSVRIGSLSLEQLNQVRLGQGGRVPTLSEALKAFPEARFNIDIKTEGGCLAAASVINELKAWDRVLVASFSGRRQRRTASALERPTAHSPGALDLVWLYLTYLLRSASLGRLFARRFDVVQVPVRTAFMKFGQKSFIEFVHRLGLLIHFWTINSPDEMLELVAIGADGVVTDAADVAVATIN